ncbi:hypothetical protein DFJ74DRAFT_648751 [Hyaloraphidium curvatum]|nr:hypothetical protein DFJ74DRAFT_648751 [Hyaloraphidium curvatum]
MSMNRRGLAALAMPGTRIPARPASPADGDVLAQRKEQKWELSSNDARRYGVGRAASSVCAVPGHRRPGQPASPATRGILARQNRTKLKNTRMINGGPEGLPQNIVWVRDIRDAASAALPHRAPSDARCKAIHAVQSRTRKGISRRPCKRESGLAPVCAEQGRIRKSRCHARTKLGPSNARFERPTSFVKRAR